MEVKYDCVSYVYNDKTKLATKALSAVNLDLKEGNITSIIGKSGSGKSTIAELMNGLIVPSEGIIKVGQYTIGPKGIKGKKNINDLRINVGLIFQFPEEQFFNMTVKDEVGFGMKYFKYRVDEITKRTIDALKMVGLSADYLERSPFTLSSGEKRKVAIASILVFNPKVIVLDEPTIGLDNASSKNLVQLIRKLKTRYKKTIVLLSHDMELVHKVSDYVYVLNNGNVVLEGDKYTVFKNEKVLEDSGIIAPKIIRFSNKVLNKKGIKIGYRDEINDLIKDIYRYVK